MDKPLFSDDGECNGTGEIQCPACGFEFSDSWEFQDSDDDIECPECHRHFSMERHIETSYTTVLTACHAEEDGDACPKEGMEFEYRLTSKDKSEIVGGKLLWVEKPESDWQIIDIWRCKTCGEKKYIYHPYSKEQDAELVMGLYTTPVRPL